MSELSNVSVDGVQQSWQQLYEREKARTLELEGYRTLLADLSRNENGRHVTDADAGDPSGVSQGNPHLNTGDVIGYSIHGTWKYVVPEPFQRGNLDAWRVRNT